MSDFSDLVKKLNAISNNEETVSATGDTVYRSVEEAVTGTRETANILKLFNKIEGERAQVAEAEEVAEDDIATQIRQRYSDFMKNEVAQGNDLSTVATAVSETNINAARLDRAFASTYKVMEQLLTITAEGGKLEGNVIAEGGDASYIGAANLKIAEALEALKEAHMYAVKQVEED